MHYILKQVTQKGNLLVWPVKNMLGRWVFHLPGESKGTFRTHKIITVEQGQGRKLFSVNGL